MSDIDTSTRKPAMVFQGEVAECGLACAAMMIDALGGDASLADLRGRFPVSTAGASLLDLQGILERSGAPALAVRFDPAQLAELPLPAILHYGGNHFVLCTRRSGGALRVFNPATGSTVIRVEHLREHITGYALVLDRSRPLRVPGARVDVPARPDVWRHTRLPRFWPLLLAGLAAGVLGFVVPVMYAATLDDASMIHAFNDWMPFAAAFVVALISVLITVYADTRRNVDAQGISRTRMSELFARLLRKRVDYFERRLLTDVFQRLFSHGRLVGERGITTLELLRSGLMALVIGGIMAWISVRLTLVTLVVVIGYWGISRYFSERRAPLLLRVEEMSGRHNDLVLETLSGIGTVKSAGLGPHRELQFSKSQASLADTALALGQLSVHESAASRTLGYAEAIVVLMLGAGLVRSELLSVGGLVSYVFFKQIALDSVTGLYWTAMRRREQNILVQRSHDLLEGAEDPAEGAPIVRMRERMVLTGLRFHYVGCTRVFELDRLQLRYGEKIALIGASGSGKSTWLKVLGGLYPATDGEVVVDDAAVGRRALRGLAYCHQAREVLFQNTVLDNVLLPGSWGFADKRRQDARALLASLGLTSAIEAMPHGWNTELSAANPHLSSGQIQRVMVARALCSLRDLVLLDEPTSNLDDEAAALTFDAILASAGTVIVATHEHAHLHRFDRVFELGAAGLRERAP